MSLNHHLPKKVDLTPKRHHGFNVLLFILGCLLPPLAVAARFGIGRDLFINIVMTLCGYFPGHGHNFYIQNIRNNANKARTPKWAIRYGLVNPAERERRLRKSQWATRYDERLPESTLVGQDLADGEEGTNYDPRPGRVERRETEGLWTQEDEIYYNDDADAPNQRNWHYPANFEGTIGDGRSKRRTKDTGGDRFERARRASARSSDSGDSYGTYPPKAATDDDVPEWGRDYGSGRKRRSSKGRKGLSSNGYDAPVMKTDNRVDTRRTSDDVFNHQF